MRTGLCGLGCALALWAASALAAPDPMRPLPGMPAFNGGAQAAPPLAALPAQALPGNTNAAAPAAPAGPAGNAPAQPAGPAVATGDAAPAALPRLMALRSDTQGRRDALIEDRWVRAGDRTPWGRVLAVHGDHVEFAPTSRQPAGADSPAAPAAAGPADQARTPAGRSKGSAAAATPGLRLYLFPRLQPTPDKAVNAAEMPFAPSAASTLSLPSAPLALANTPTPPPTRRTSPP